MSLNERLPLSNKGSKFVIGERHAVEVGQTRFSLNFVDSELDLSEGVVLVFLQVTQRRLNNSSLERVVGVLQSRGSVGQGLSNIFDFKHGRSLDIKPVLSGERVDDLNSVSDSLDRNGATDIPFS